jgi:hypothetical protein
VRERDSKRDRERERERERETEEVMPIFWLLAQASLNALDFKLNLFS